MSSGWSSASSAICEFTAGPKTSELYIDQFLGPKASFHEAAATSLETVLLGMGAWALLACFGAADCDSRLALDMGTLQREVGDAAAFDFGMARRPVCDADGRHLAGCRLDRLRPVGERTLAATRRPAGLAIVWACAAVMCGVGLRDVTDRLARAPVLIERQEAEQIWKWIKEVGDNDAVLADYEVSAPLSSRRQLYSYVMDVNLPKNFPELDSDVSLAVHPQGDIRSSTGCWSRGLKSFYQGKYLIHRPARRVEHGARFRFFPILREHKLSIRCLYTVPLDRERLQIRRSSPKAVCLNRTCDSYGRVCCPAAPRSRELQRTP